MNSLVDCKIVRMQSSKRVKSKLAGKERHANNGNNNNNKNNKSKTNLQITVHSHCLIVLIKSNIQKYNTQRLNPYVCLYPIASFIHSSTHRKRRTHDGINDGASRRANRHKIYFKQNQKKRNIFFIYLF